MRVILVAVEFDDPVVLFADRLMIVVELYLETVPGRLPHGGV